MMNGREKLYFLLERINDVREVTPFGKPIKIHPVQNLNKHYYQDELIGLLTKLEKESKVIKIISMPNPEEGYLTNDNGYYVFDLLPAFDDFYFGIQFEPGYIEFTGTKPPYSIERWHIEKLYKNITDVDEQIRIRREALAVAESSINGNPFYSEATRVGQLAKLEQQAQTDIGNFIKERDSYLAEIELKKNDAQETTQIGTTKASKTINLSLLHPDIVSKCKTLFEAGTYPEAVEKGFKIVRDRLRELTDYETGSEAFGKGKIHIKGAAAQNVDHDFNEGVKFLTMAIDKFRNEKSHTSNAKIEDPQKAYEYLALSSLAMNLLDQAEITAS